MAPTVLPGLAQQIYPTVDPQQAAAPAPQQQPTGILDSFFGGGSMTPNQQMMLSLGAGMLANSRKRPGEAFGAAVPQAMQQQAIAQKLFSEDEEKKRKERARSAFSKMLNADGYIKNLNLPDDTVPYWRELANENPEAAFKLAKERKSGGEARFLTMEELPESLRKVAQETGRQFWLDSNGGLKEVGKKDGPLVQMMNGERYTPGDKKLDEWFVTDVYGPTSAGGAATSASQIATLKGVMQDIADGKPVSGPGIGVVQALGGDTAQAIFNPEARDAQERVASVVQTTLRETLGGQFAALEGTQLINRAFNPALPPEKNARRVAQLLAKTEAMYKAKMDMIDYYEVNRTLSRFKLKDFGPKIVNDFIALDQQWAAEDKKAGIDIGGGNAADGASQQQPAPQDEGALGGFTDYMKTLFGGNP